MRTPINVLFIEENAGDVRPVKEEALTYISEQAGSYFDPQVVDLFSNVIKKA